MSKWGSAKKRQRTNAARVDVATNTTDMGDAMEIWDGDEDGIDDSVLLMASQMVEEDGREKPNANGRADGAVPSAVSVDQSELAEMSRLLEQDADWNDDDVFSEAAEAAKASSMRLVAPSVVERPPKPTTSVQDGFTKPRTPPSPHDEMKSLKDLLARKQAEVKALNKDKYSRHGEVLFLRGELSKRDAALQKERAERARAAELRTAEVRQMEEARKAQMEKMETEAAFLRRDLENMADQVKRTKMTTLKQESEEYKKQAGQVKRAMEQTSEELKRIVSRVRNGPIAIDESLLCESSSQSQKASNAKPSYKSPPKNTVCASIQTDMTDGIGRRRRSRNFRRIRMRRDPPSRNIATLASAVNKRLTMIGAEQKSNEVFSAAIISTDSTGDVGASLSAAEIIMLKVKSHIEKRSTSAQVLVDLMKTASMFLESKAVATRPQAEKESMDRALKGVAVGFSGRKLIFQVTEEASDKKALSGMVSDSEESDWDCCLAAFFNLLQVAVSSSAVTPSGFSALLFTLTYRLRQVTPTLIFLLNCFNAKIRLS